MSPVDKPSSSAGFAGGLGAVAVCCAIKVLIIGGIIAGVSGVAIGGIALAAGLAVAATVWLVAILLRRRAGAATGSCAVPARDDAAERVQAGSRR